MLALPSALWGCQAQPSEGTPQPAAVSIQQKGSDTLVNLALAWAEAYMRLHPQVRISVTGGGSGTGIAALINGTVDIANASREMKPEEIAEAQKNGHTPKEYKEQYTVIIVPHSIQQASRIADYAAFFLMGELIEHQPGKGLFTTPRNRRTEDYVTGRFG